MNKSFFLTFLLILWLVVLSCGLGSSHAPPSTLLSQKSMEELMLQMYLSEAHIETLKISEDSAKRLFRAHEIDVMRQVGISDVQLKESYAYYRAYPQLFTKVIDSVVQRLVVLQENSHLKGSR